MTVVNVDTEEEVSYQIVGEDEADIKEGLISINSPIAQAHHCQTRRGPKSWLKPPVVKKIYEILSIKYI
ncbi:MAG: GreA/GreB family elongation factor [Thiotrichaceae bacterium]